MSLARSWRKQNWFRCAGRKPVEKWGENIQREINLNKNKFDVNIHCQKSQSIFASDRLLVLSDREQERKREIDAFRLFLWLRCIAVWLGRERGETHRRISGRAGKTLKNYSFMEPPLPSPPSETNFSLTKYLNSLDTSSIDQNQLLLFSEYHRYLPVEIWLGFCCIAQTNERSVP